MRLGMDRRKHARIAAWFELGDWTGRVSFSGSHAAFFGSKGSKLRGSYSRFEKGRSSSDCWQERN
jgi:hypothetical protein